IVRGLALLALELLDRRADLASELANAARHDVTAAELVEDGAADALLGERQERLVARGVGALGGPRGTGEAGGREVFTGDPVGAATRHAERDPAGDLDVLGDQTIAFGRRAADLCGVGLHRDSPWARAGDRHHDVAVAVGAREASDRVS